MIDATAMSTIGTTTGNNESQSGGSSDSGRAAIASSASNVEPDVARTGTGMRRSNQRARSHVAARGMMPNATPATIAIPSCTFNASATNNGPGAGGIVPFAIAAPPAITSAFMR